MTAPAEQKKNENKYVRPTKVVTAIGLASAMSADELVSALSVTDRASPDYLPSECLVALLRNAHRHNDEVCFEAVFPKLLKRCEKIVDQKISSTAFSDAEGLRDEIVGQFAELFALDGTGNRPQQLDFFECKFNAAFRFFRIDILRTELKTERDRSSRIELSTLVDTTDADVLAEVRHMIRNTSDPQCNDAYRDLLRGVRALPPLEREAFYLVHLMGYPISSKYSNKRTAATICGVSGRSIQTRLKNAATRLRPYGGNS